MACSQLRLHDEFKLRNEINKELLNDTLNPPEDPEFSDEEIIEIENKWNDVISGLQMEGDDI